MDALRPLIYKIFLEMFYKKRKGKLIFLKFFYIFYKSDVKSFLKFVINNFSKDIRLT